MTNWVILKKSGKATILDESYSFFNALEVIANTNYNSYSGNEYFYDEPIRIFKNGIELKFPGNIRDYACAFVDEQSAEIDKVTAAVRAKYNLGENNEPS